MRVAIFSAMTLLIAACASAAPGTAASGGGSTTGSLPATQSAEAEESVGEDMAEPPMVEQETEEPSAPRPCPTWFADGHFAISGYSVPTALEDEPSRSMAELAIAGYTHVGPFYDESPDAELAEAGASGLCVVHHIGTPGVSGQAADAERQTWTNRATEQVAAVVADPFTNELVSMWMVLPEELDLNSASQRELLVAIVNAIRLADPLGRPVAMFMTSNADEVEFGAAAASLDAVVQGQYLVNDGDERLRAALAYRLDRARGFVDQASAAASLVIPAIEHGNSDLDIAADDEPLIAHWVRHDILTTLAADADGFLAFSHFPRGRPSAFAAYNDAFVNVVSELTESGVIDGPTTRVDLDAVVVNGPTEIVVTEINSTGDIAAEQRSTHAVLAERDQNRWILLVNHANEPVTLSIDGLEGRFVMADGSVLVGDGGPLEIRLDAFDAMLGSATE